MPNAFQTKFERDIRAPDERVFGIPITLKRDSIESESFTAVRSAEEYRSLEHETGLSIVIRKRVYHFNKTSAILAGDTIVPRAGDYIVDGTEELRLCAIDGKPAVEEEPGGYRWLVRTDKIA